MKNQKLITASDSFDVLESPFKDEKDRIKYITEHYGKMDIAKAFSLYYGLELTNEDKDNDEPAVQLGDDLKLPPDYFQFIVVDEYDIIGLSREAA